MNGFWQFGYSPCTYKNCLICSFIFLFSEKLCNLLLILANLLAILKAKEPQELLEQNQEIVNENN